MEKVSQMFKVYFKRLVFRTAIFLIVLSTYIIDKPFLDFTSIWTKSHIFAPTRIFWLIILIEMIIQISPKSKISRGCLKQFQRYYKEPEEHYNRKELKNAIHQNNQGAIKVLTTWIILNLGIGILYLKNIIGIEEMVLLCAFYYLSDLICVILFCPFQKFLMKNKCCVTCRIFAWGHPMMLTPLIFIIHFYSWSLVGIAMYITIRWEYTYRKYPERFFEETNSNLKCMNCTDKMCKIKSK